MRDLPPFDQRNSPRKPVNNVIEVYHHLGVQILVSEKTIISGSCFGGGYSAKSILEDVLHF